MTIGQQNAGLKDSQSSAIAALAWDDTPLVPRANREVDGSTFRLSCGWQ